MQTWHNLLQQGPYRDCYATPRCSNSCTSSTPVWSRLCPEYPWELCWLSSALCLIKIKSLLERLQSAKTSKERLVKLQDYLQTQRNEIFFYCRNWKSMSVCHGRNMCKELLCLPMFCPAPKSYPSLQIHLPSSSLSQLLWQEGTSPALRICFSSSASTVQKHQLQLLTVMVDVSSLHTPIPDHASPVPSKHFTRSSLRSGGRELQTCVTLLINHICVLQVDVFEWYLRSYCIHWHILTFFYWHLKKQTDVAWLSWTSLRPMGIRSRREVTFEHKSV